MHASLVCDRIVCGINNDQARGRLLREVDITLQKTIVERVRLRQAKSRHLMMKLKYIKSGLLKQCKAKEAMQRLKRMIRRMHASDVATAMKQTIIQHMANV